MSESENVETIKIINEFPQGMNTLEQKIWEKVIMTQPEKAYERINKLVRLLGYQKTINQIINLFRFLKYNQNDADKLLIFWLDYFQMLGSFYQKHKFDEQFEKEIISKKISDRNKIHNLYVAKLTGENLTNETLDNFEKIIKETILSDELNQGYEFCLKWKFDESNNHYYAFRAIKKNNQN
jgi:hypothetical protein